MTYPIGQLPTPGQQVSAYQPEYDRWLPGIYEKPQGYNYGILILEDGSKMLWSLFSEWRET